MEYKEIISARYLMDYKIQITFNDGGSYMIDLKDELHGEVFEPLRDINLFKSFTLNPFTIQWPNGADFSPNFLHHLAISQHSLTLDSEK